MMTQYKSMPQPRVLVKLSFINEFSSLRLLVRVCVDPRHSYSLETGENNSTYHTSEWCFPYTLIG